MKKFDPQIGGHRFRLDDLILLQQAYAEALAGLVSLMSPDKLSCIISGLQVSVTGSPQVHSVKKGYAAFKGEVFKVEAADIPFDSSKRLFLRIEEKVITPSPVIYQDTSSKNVHYERTMVVKYADSTDQADVNGMYIEDTNVGVTVPPGAIIEYELVAGEKLTDLFDDTGLGKGKLKGWAVCNGNNGTTDLRGQFTMMPSAGMFNTAPLVDNAVAGITLGSRFGKKEALILQENLPKYSLKVIDPGHVHPAPKVYYSKTNFGNENSDEIVLFSDSGKKDGSGQIKTNNIVNGVDITSAKTGISVDSDGGNKPFSIIPTTYAMIKIKRIAY